jgi:DNA-directed RNA polymerase specialized sigma24 family protein
LCLATGETLKTRPLPTEFEALFRYHYEFVHRTAYRVTGNFADAEDVIQTLLLRLSRRELSSEIAANPRGYPRVIEKVSLGSPTPFDRPPMTSYNLAL